VQDFSLFLLGYYVRDWRSTCIRSDVFHTTTAPNPAAGNLVKAIGMGCFLSKVWLNKGDDFESARDTFGVWSGGMIHKGLSTDTPPWTLGISMVRVAHSLHRENGQSAIVWMITLV
jgi:hypothetical protein